MASKVSGFPSMVLKESEKTDEWCNSVVDAIVSYMSYQNSSFNTQMILSTLLNSMVWHIQLDW